MEKEDSQVPENKKDNLQNKTNQWIDKAEAIIDEAAEKIHKSDSYQKTGKAVDKVTRKIFREAGRWWGKF